MMDVIQIFDHKLGEWVATSLLFFTGKILPKKKKLRYEKNLKIKSFFECFNHQKSGKKILTESQIIYIWIK
jgi:hypothetical protein